MRYTAMFASAAMALLSFAGSHLFAHSGPFDGKTFKGRIAYSADGNHNDEDDWAASPVVLAILAEFGVKDKLIHFDYNSILNNHNPEWAKIHEESILGAVERYGYRRSVFFDDQSQKEAAVASITKAINESSAENPLYFILAGPMEIAYLGIQASDPAKRKYVYCISHSRWNDGYATKYTYNYGKRSVIPSGVHWIQIRDQNRGLATGPFGRPSTPEEWKPWEWMRSSRHEHVRWIHERLKVTTRADSSDAGMAYFLVTGDEDTDIAKLRTLFEDKKVPAPVKARTQLRLEAENFLELKNGEVKPENSREISHRLTVQAAGPGPMRIRELVHQPYAAVSAVYDVEIRYFDAKGGSPRFTLLVNGVQQGEPWTAAANDDTWRSHRTANVRVDEGDEIAIEVSGEGDLGRIDYVQLDLKSATRFHASRPLDDPRALPGQVIVAGSKPGYLKYNGGGPAFLAGPDNPEDFFFHGTLNPDGTRSGGDQEEIIDRMARSRVNAFHCMMFRMKRGNIKNEGDDQHNPFVDQDPAKPLNQKVLDQWDRWIGMMEERGIVVHLEFYNDATDVERMGWVLDAKGNLHPHEERFISGIVDRFKHHKNIIWGIEESGNKLPTARVAHFKKIGEVIAKADRHRHPIVQSFVVPDDPDNDFPAGGSLAEPYIGDPNIRLATWLHVVPHGEDMEKAHQTYLHYYKLSAPHFIGMKNETFHKPYLNRAPLSRRYMWSAAMAGLHTLEAQHYANKAAHFPVLREDGFLAEFLEGTDVHTMQPRDDLKHGSTRWVLANPGQAYVAYTYDYSGPMGVKGLTAGSYDLKWMDTVDGKTVTQTGVAVTSGDAAWAKPASLGNELALSIKRRY